MAAPLTVDHVTLAWSSLEPLERALAEAGLRADYGGPHGNRATHMDVLGFDDGSYVELIAPFEPGTPIAWEAQMRGEAGPCAWAASLSSTAALAAEAERIRALGIPVRGPMASSRTRPDGRRAEWEYAFLGEGEPGATLPFIIADHTPRDLRVRPSASVAGAELTGVELVVLGVPDVVQAAALFHRVYDWPAPTLHKALAFGATLAHFPGTPVVLAADLSAEDLTLGPSRRPPDAPRSDGQKPWLARRLARFGPAPCAFLLGTLDMATSQARLPLVAGGSWFGRQVAWLEPARMLDIHLGVVAIA
jgi:hypothetical protein